MKTLPVLTAIAAFVAFVLLPLHPGFTVSALFLVAVAPIILADYSPARRLNAATVAAKAALRRSERLGLAA